MWAKEWDNIFSKNEWGKYPSEHLVRFFKRNFKKKKLKILEIGSGTGANLWFFCREGHKVYGLDGSKVALKICDNFLKKDKFNYKLFHSDAKKLPFKDNFFDLVVDIECLYSNPIMDAIQISNEVFRVLKKGSFFYSLTFSNFCTGSTNLKSKKINTFKFKRNIRFSTINDIKNIFKKFKINNLNRVSRTIKNQKILIDEWEIQAKK